MLQIGLSEEPDPTFAAAAHAASGGNPFLLGELVTALLDAEVRPTARAAGRVAAIGPHGVTRAMLRRLAAVGEGATALARTVAVLGGGTELEHAAALAELDDETAAGSPRHSCASRSVATSGRCRSCIPWYAGRSTPIFPRPRGRAHARAARILARGGHQGGRRCRPHSRERSQWRRRGGRVPQLSSAAGRGARGDGGRRDVPAAGASGAPGCRPTRCGAARARCGRACGWATGRRGGAARRGRRRGDGPRYPRQHRAQAASCARTRGPNRRSRHGRRRGARAVGL